MEINDKVELEYREKENICSITIDITEEIKTIMENEEIEFNKFLEMLKVMITENLFKITNI